MENPAAGKIRAGAVLIRDGAPFPPSLRLETEAYSKGWRLVKDLDGYGLDRMIRETGWNFFYMAGEIKASALGYSERKSLSRAVKRTLAKLKTEKFNSLEIRKTTTTRFLGLPWVTVFAHPRHVQKEIFLYHRFAEWDRARLGGTAN